MDINFDRIFQTSGRKKLGCGEDGALALRGVKGRHHVDAESQSRKVSEKREIYVQAVQNRLDYDCGTPCTHI